MGLKKLIKLINLCGQFNKLKKKTNHQVLVAHLNKSLIASYVQIHLNLSFYLSQKRRTNLFTSTKKEEMSLNVDKYDNKMYI